MHILKRNPRIQLFVTIIAIFNISANVKGKLPFLFGLSYIFMQDWYFMVFMVQMTADPLTVHLNVE